MFADQALGARCDEVSTIFRNLTNLLCSAHSARALQAGWPVSSMYMRKVSPFEAGSRRKVGQVSTAYI